MRVPELEAEEQRLRDQECRPGGEGLHSLCVNPRGDSQVWALSWSQSSTGPARRTVLPASPSPGLSLDPQSCCILATPSQRVDFS